MGVAKSTSNEFRDEPSIFALLVDNISKMSKSEQKLLWMKLNRKKISALAWEIDNSASSENLSEDEIGKLIKEARSYERKKKKD